MAKQNPYKELMTLQPGESPWERVFTVAPLILVGTKEPGGGYDLAPKHMVTPIGLSDFFGFVCTPRHATYRNARRERTFTVTYLRPTQVVLASLAAAPRCDDSSKPSLAALPTFPATKIDAVFVEDGSLFLECELLQVVDGFDDDSLIIGRIVASHVHKDCLRTLERDDNDLVARRPLLGYLYPGRFSRIRRSQAFPFPADYKR